MTLTVFAPVSDQTQTVPVHPGCATDPNMNFAKIGKVARDTATANTDELYNSRATLD
jgi:hypothetical protein